MVNYLLLKKDFSNIFDELFPKIDNMVEIINDSSSIARGIIKANELITKNKFNFFIENLEIISNQKINDFITDIKNSEAKKTIFIECMKKTIYLDDTLQIFILASLMKSFKENDKFEYEEKKLYYNIKQFSEDDFTIYYCFYKKYILNNEKQRTFLINGEIINKQLVEVVLKFFISYNILEDKTIIKVGNSSNLTLKVGLTKYSKKFFNILDTYFKEKEKICEEILPIQKDYNKVFTSELYI